MIPPGERQKPMPRKTGRDREGFLRNLLCDPGGISSLPPITRRAHNPLMIPPGERQKPMPRKTGRDREGFLRNLLCDPGGIQTPDLQNRNLTFYSTELRGRHLTLPEPAESYELRIYKFFGVLTLPGNDFLYQRFPIFAVINEFNLL